jgi:transcriptional regulator with XRE-family HTH domain
MADSKNIDPIDVHLGGFLHWHRRLRGLTQKQLADAVGVSFQQIQKYEKGKNRISATCLWNLSQALEIPVGYFYHDLAVGKSAQTLGEADILDRQETLDLIRAYDQLGERQRRRLLNLAKSLNGASDEINLPADAEPTFPPDRPEAKGNTPVARVVVNGPKPT